MQRTIDHEVDNTNWYIYNTTSTPGLREHHGKWSRRRECTKGLERFPWDTVLYVWQGDAIIMSQQLDYLKEAWYNYICWHINVVGVGGGHSKASPNPLRAKSN